MHEQGIEFQSPVWQARILPLKLLMQHENCEMTES